MLRRIVTAAVALTAGVPAAASAQADAEFAVIRDWDTTDGAHAVPVLDTLRLHEGSIWTPKAYGDFVFRFEYRPLAATGRATLHVRATIAGDRTIGSYDVTLDHGPERGRLDATRQSLHESPFRPSASVDDLGTWVAAEIRADQDRLTVLLDGVPVASGDRAEAFFGTIGFRAAKGGVELRGMRLAALNVPAPLDPDLPRAGAPGVTVPTVVKRGFPMYSRAALQARAQGVAKVEFVIEADGTPGGVRVLDAPHPDLALAAVDCVRKWRFTAPLKDGVPAAIVATMEVAFQLK